MVEVRVGKEGYASWRFLEEGGTLYALHAERPLRYRLKAAEGSLGWLLVPQKGERSREAQAP